MKRNNNNNNKPTLVCPFCYLNIVINTSLIFLITVYTYTYTGHGKDTVYKTTIIQTEYMTL